MQDDLYYYVTPTVNRSRPIRERFVLASDLPNHRGFQSVYGFSYDTVSAICNRGHFRELRHTPVGAIYLPLDFDSNLEAADEFHSSLERHGCSFRRFESGNRSVHFHVTTDYVFSKTLPMQHKEWVRFNAPGADLTIYTHTGLYRLEGTWHEKNPGHRKQLVYEHTGPNVPLFTEPKVRARPLTSATTLQEASVYLQFASRDKVTAGGRRCHVWRIGTLAYDAGVDYAQALAYAQRWNSNYAVPPLDSDVVEQKVYEAYQQRLYNGVHNEN